MTAIAVEAFQHLYERLAAAAAGADDPRERLMEVGVAYVLTGRDHPGHCAVVFRSDLVDTADPRYQEWGDRAYGVLEDTVRAVAERHNPALDVDVASRLCWSAMQGLMVLHPSMGEIAAKRGAEPMSLEEHATGFGALMLTGLLGP